MAKMSSQDQLARDFSRAQRAYDNAEDPYWAADGIDDAECCECGEQLDERALERLRDDPDVVNVMCTECYKKENGDEDV
jgi:Zn ribbon nucleic-acid-binding protein